MIVASSLTKRYRGKTAVEDLSFTVEPGKVTGFLGPNGAGKSTTMRLMLGLDNGQGTTTFDDKPLHAHAQPSKVVGILLEAKAFHPTRSARQHLRILAQAGGIPLARVETVLEQVGLTAVAHKGPGKFSLGMSQRLGIAAAILGEPKYLLLDEPANGLDPEGIAWLRQFLSYYADQGNGVLVSSHLLSEIALMADNVIVIGQGKLIVDSPMNELLDKYAHNKVFARVRGAAKLEVALRTKMIAYKRIDGGFLIENMDTDTIGKMAFEAGVPVLELVKRQDSLEDTFLRLTADTVEYHGGKK